MDDRLIYKTGIRLLILGAGFLVTRFLLFAWMGSYDWHRVMILLSSAIVCLFSVNGCELTASCIPFLYVASYVAAYYFHTDGYDPGGGATSNTWYLWTAIYAVSVFLVYVAERMFHVKHKGARNG